MAMESNPDYAAFRSAFRIEDLAAQLSGDLQTDLNVCTECCDRKGAVVLFKPRNGPFLPFVNAPDMDSHSKRSPRLTSLSTWDDG